MKSKKFKRVRGKMRELESLLVFEMTEKRPLYIGNMEDILRIENLNTKNVFELNFGNRKIECQKYF